MSEQSWRGWDPEPFDALDVSAVRARWDGWIVEEIFSPTRGVIGLVAWESQADRDVDGSGDDHRVGIAYANE